MSPTYHLQCIFLRYMPPKLNLYFFRGLFHQPTTSSKWVGETDYVPVQSQFVLQDFASESSLEAQRNRKRAVKLISIVISTFAGLFKTVHIHTHCKDLTSYCFCFPFQSTIIRVGGCRQIKKKKL